MISWLLRIALLFWCISMLVLGMWIWTENTTVVTVNYFGQEFTEQSLGVIICQMLALGGILGFLTSFMSMHARLILQKRRNKKVNKEIEKLKNTLHKE